MTSGPYEQPSLWQRVLGKLRYQAWHLRFLPVYASAGRQVASIKTYTSRSELDALYRLARALPRGAVAVEIGSYLGASTCFIGAGLRKSDGRLYCVDTWGNQTMDEGERDTFAEFRRHTARFADIITTVRKPSAQLVITDVSTPIDFAFIDGDHSYDATRTDLRTLAPWVKEGGVVAFHDAVTYAFPGVPRVIGEALACGAFRVGGVVGNLVWIVRTGQPLPDEWAQR